MSKHTPGPWPWAYTGDGKRIVIGKGLVEGPNGYEVAEVYSDDCPREVAEANARLISLAPEMAEALREFAQFAVALDGAGGNRPKTGVLYSLHTKTGDAEITVEMLQNARALLAKLEAEG